MFTSAYSIYFIFFTLATAGLPVALSRLIAEAVRSAYGSVSIAGEPVRQTPLDATPRPAA